MHARRTAAGALLTVVLLAPTGWVAGPAEAAGDAPTPGLDRVLPLGQELPGVGPATLSRVPPATGQALVVTGEGPDSSVSTAVLYARTETGWAAAGPAWPAHNGHRGWTRDHRAGDRRTPVGVFPLTAAGGLLPDPGTKLPYDRSDAFAARGTGFLGEPLAGSFDHVIAIDYNRVPGTSPLDGRRPEGGGRGGGIWLHVDHVGPTHGCVTLSSEHLRALLRALDPAARPVVVMGDAPALAR